MVNLLEKELIDSLNQGDHKSFEVIFRTYYSRLCIYAFEYTKQMETAEDLVKDMFIQFWEQREKISLHTSLSGYLYRSVHNICVNYLERDKSRKFTFTTEELTAIEFKIKQPFSSDFPFGSLLAQELEEHITRQVERLPAQCKEIFILSRVEGLSHKKIAEKLEISENTVKVQIFRALKKIKETLPLIIALLFSLFR